MFDRVATPSHSDFGARGVSPPAGVQIRVKLSVGVLSSSAARRDPELPARAYWLSITAPDDFVA